MPLQKSKHSHIAKNMILVGVYLLLGRIAGAVKEIVIANKYGTDEILDIYLIVLTILYWLPSIWASLSDAVLVPISNKLALKERKLFNQELLYTVIVTGLILTILTMLLLPKSHHILPFSFTESGSLQFTKMVFYLGPIVLLSMITFQFSALLLAEEKHLNTLINGIPPIVLSLFVFLSSDDKLFEPLIYGTLVGAILHLITAFMFLKSSAYFGSPRWTRGSSGWTHFNSAFVIMIGTTVVISLTPFVDQILASSLGTGNVSILGYATRLTALVLGLGAIAIGRSILPVLSKMDNIEQQLKIVKTWYLILIAIGLIASLLLWNLSPLIVKILFERGAFDSNDTMAVSNTFRFGLSQVPFYFAGIVLVQYFASNLRYKVLLWSSVIALSAKCAFAYELTKRFGVNGIALSTGLMYCCTFTYLSSVAFLNSKPISTCKD